MKIKNSPKSAKGLSVDYFGTFHEYVCRRHLSYNLHTVYEEHAVLLYRRDRTMVAYGKIYFEA